MEDFAEFGGNYMQCRARSRRSGKRCKKSAVKYKRVCRMHGGCTPRRNPTLSLERLPYLSEFAKSTIGTEIIHAIRHGNQHKLANLHNEIEHLQREACERKMAVAESPCLQTVNDLMETEKLFFQKQREFVNSYFSPERTIRLTSVSWIFHAFERVVSDNLPNLQCMDIFTKMNRLYMSLVFPNLIFDESRKIETQYLKTNFPKLIDQAMADKVNPFGTIQVLKVIRKHEEIKAIDAELDILPFGITIDEVFQVYQVFGRLLNEISCEDVLREKLLRSLRNIGYGIFQNENYQTRVNYPIFSLFCQENDNAAA